MSVKGSVFILIAIVGGLAAAKPAMGAAKGKKPSPSKGRQVCSTKELRHKDCHLRLGAQFIQIWKDKIIAHDKVHRSLRPLPASGDSVQWESLRIVTKLKRNFLEFYYWSAPETQGEISSLNWVLFELHPDDVSLKMQKIVRRRKKVATKAGKKPKYDYDKTTPHKLLVQKGKLMWKVGFETGELP